MKIVNRPQFKINDEFKDICREIESHNKTDDEWSKIESSDMFQTEHFCGGYSSIEQSFWFSYYDKEQIEWWLEIKSAEINSVINNQLLYLDLYEPN